LPNGSYKYLNKIENDDFEYIEDENDLEAEDSDDGF